MIVICALGRPARLGRVLSQWGWQTHDCELVLVPGTAGLGDEVPRNVKVLDRELTIGSARNAGMRYGRERNAGWGVFFDDDNYYGPRYVEQVHEHENEGDVLSQGIGFVRHARGLAYYGNPIGFAPAHATAVRLDVVPVFPAVSFEEDVHWSAQLEQPIAWLPPWHSVYYRTGEGHAYVAGDAVFRHRFGPAIELGSVPDEVVDYPDKRWLEGKRVESSIDDVFAELKAETRAHAARL